MSARLARLVLVSSALPFGAIGLAFLVAPAELAARAGISLAGALADSDVRAVYGGLQLACAALLAIAARGNEAGVRAGVAAQVALFGGLASARLASLALVGSPGTFGLALLAAEALALAAGVVAWRGLARSSGGRVARHLDAAISRAVPNDWHALLPLVESFQREEGYAGGDAALGAAVRELLGDPQRGRVLVAREGERAVGYAALCFGFSIEFRGRDAFVDELYVVPERRGSGLGRALLRALEAEARACGVRQLHLEVELRNDAARRLYVAEGFAATGRELLSKALST